MRTQSDRVTCIHRLGGFVNHTPKNKMVLCEYFSQKAATKGYKLPEVLSR